MGHVHNDYAADRDCPLCIKRDAEIERLKDRNYLETPDGLRVGPEMWRSKCIELAEVTAERDELRALVKADHAARLAQVLAQVAAERDELRQAYDEACERSEKYARERDRFAGLLREVEHYVDLFHSEFDIKLAARIVAALKEESDG